MIRASATRHRPASACDVVAALPSSRVTGIYACVADAAWRYAEQIVVKKDFNMTPHGHFHWNELLTANPERAKQFYQKTIGWQFEPMQMDDGAMYWIAYEGDTPVAGLFPTNRPSYEGVPESWMSYLSVDDVDARAKKAVDAGAKLMRPIFDVKDVGRIAILTEPGGAGVGWMTPVAR